MSAHLRSASREPTVFCSGLCLFEPGYLAGGTGEGTVRALEAVGWGVRRSERVSLIVAVDHQHKSPRKSSEKPLRAFAWPRFLCTGERQFAANLSGNPSKRASPGVCKNLSSSVHGLVFGEPAS